MVVKKVVTLVFGLAVAGLIWVVGMTVIPPDSAEIASVTDAYVNDVEKTLPTTAIMSSGADEPIDHEQSPSAKKLQALLNTQTSLPTEIEQTEATIAQLDQTLRKFDQQLQSQGINPPDQNITEPTEETPSSTVQRLQAIRDHINKTPVE